jgi:GUN4-like
MASREENENSYRNHLQRLMKAGPLSDDDRVALENDRMYLRLSPARAEEIKAEVAKELGQITKDIETPTENREEEADRKPAPAVLPVKVGHDSEETDSAHAVTTLIPPPDAAKYLEHLEKYGQAFLEAQRTENFYLSEETRERLQKLAKQFELPAADVRNTEQRILAELYLHNGPPQPRKSPVDPPDPPIVVTKLDPQLEHELEEIAGLLKLKNWEKADRQTFELLLKVIKPTQSTQLSLDDEALREAIRKFGAERIPKDMIRAKEVIRNIDQLWQEASESKFGFTPQLQIYGNNVITQEADLDRKRPFNRAQALAFSKQVGWWIRGLEFLKYYNQLDFSPDAPSAAPVGHLPARWFWGIPRQENFLHGGLRLVRERGGCGMDAFAIPAFMSILSKTLI